MTKVLCVCVCVCVCMCERDRETDRVCCNVCRSPHRRQHDVSIMCVL